jgi:hypothetical protein
MRVTNGIPFGRPLLLPVGTVNCVQTLKAADTVGGGGPADKPTLCSSSCCTCPRQPQQIRSCCRWLQCGTGTDDTTSNPTIPTNDHNISNPTGIDAHQHQSSSKTAHCTVRVLGSNLHDAIGFHAFAPLEALPCVWPMAFLLGVHSSYRLSL